MIIDSQHSASYSFAPIVSCEINAAYTVIARPTFYEHDLLIPSNIIGRVFRFGSDRCLNNLQVHIRTGVNPGISNG